MKLSRLDERTREGLSPFPRIELPCLLASSTPKSRRMEESDPSHISNFWNPSSLPHQDVDVVSGMDMGQSWGTPFTSSDYLAPPRQNLFPPAAFHPRNESGPQRPQYTNSPLNPSSSRSPNRNSSQFDLPNFPLPRSPNTEPSFPLSRSPNDLNRTDEDFYSSYRDLAGSPLQLPSINAFSSIDFTPTSRPPSRFSWDSEGSSLFGSSTWATTQDLITQELNTQEPMTQGSATLEPSFQDQTGFVDLTAESPVMSHPNRKRKASATAPNPTKRGKPSVHKSRDSHVKDENTKVDEVDLRDVDDDNDLTKLLEQQRVAAVKAQQEQANKPLKLSNLQCIICMEPMTNITVTHCGEFLALLAVGHCLMIC